MSGLFGPYEETKIIREYIRNKPEKDIVYGYMWNINTKRPTLNSLKQSIVVIAGTEVGVDEERFIKRCRCPVIRWIHSEDLRYSTETLFEM